MTETREHAADAEALGTLFAPDGDDGHRLVRRHERPTLQTGPASRTYLVSQRPLKYFEAYTGKFDAGGSTGPEQYAHGDAHHPGESWSDLGVGDRVVAHWRVGDSVAVPA